MDDVSAAEVGDFESERLLASALRDRRVIVLTGAGVSTESGIPDYRGEGSRRRTSIQGPEFRRSAAVRARYWARAAIGWQRLGGARPNPGHEAIARLEAGGVVTAVITQNVDRLHQAAGSKRVVELHGAIAEVSCLSGDACGVVEPRDEVQQRLLERNADLFARITSRAPSAPDGDADLEIGPADLATFAVPTCSGCGAAQRPRVVLFGENVPRTIVDEAFALIDAADALLVAGTSLAVFSGYRFLRRAVERGMPIGIVNIGPVRGQENAAACVRGRTGDVLPRLAEHLLAPVLRETVRTEHNRC
jgi:NAD-dependent SIR2 family protein deacetylase